MDNSKADPNKLPDSIESYIKGLEKAGIDFKKMQQEGMEGFMGGLDIKALLDLRGSIDREKLMKDAAEMLEKLKNSLPPQDKK